MILDRLLHALEYHNEISSDERYAIIAALRAGQAMRDELVTLKSIQRAPNTAGVKAWDAATKGDDK